MISYFSRKKKKGKKEEKKKKKNPAKENPPGHLSTNIHVLTPCSIPEIQPKVEASLG